MARRQQHSAEFEHYRRTLQCPSGHRHALTFIEGAGDVVGNLPLRDRLILENPFPQLDDRVAALPRLGRLRQRNHDRSGGLVIERFRLDSMFSCATCRDQWPVFTQPGLRIIGDRETGLRETPIGTQELRVDRRQDSTDVTLALEFRHEWVRRLEVGFERVTSAETTRSAGVKAAYGPAQLSAGLQHRITEGLKATYSFSTQATKTTTVTIPHELPARKITVITTHWKQVWQEHECQVRLPGDGETVRLPYRIAFDVTFDQRAEHL
ncbi:MAG TPA: hypothetical protein VGQ05_18900 [Streptosporangiaceae bacterium]|jgi:hypothetical protein|nr:hypothetical protein [Streptosporangiaceae bacterium]